MGTMTSLYDGFKNFVANLGTDRDKASYGRFQVEELDDRRLEDIYRTSWLAKKIVDVPAFDACRKWRLWNAPSAQVTKLENEEKRLGLQRKVLDAMRKGRLFGGAGIYIGTKDSDVSKELVIKPGMRVEYLAVILKRNLQAAELELDILSPYYMQPKMYRLSSGSRSVVDIHPSRVVRFLGSPHPDEENQTGPNYGWSDPVLQTIMASIVDSAATNANVASLVYEAKVDVLAVPDLMRNIQDSKYEKDMLKRTSLAARAKAINGMLLIDNEEEYTQKSASFSQLPELMREFIQFVAGAADIPVTRFLGQSPGGMNATGESDLRNYYDRVQSMQTLEIGPALALLDQLLIMGALGSQANVWYTWNSLWQTTSKERADIGKTIADTIKTIADTKLINDDALGEAAITTITEHEVLSGLEQAIAKHGAQPEEPEPEESEEEDPPAGETE